MINHKTVAVILGKHAGVANHLGRINGSMWVINEGQKGHVGISVVKETAQCGEREGKQAWRYVNEEIYGRSTH